MSQHAAVLFANDAFYVAFRNRDAAAMNEVWAKSEPVTCIHPGWQPLNGRPAVMDSWRSILDNPASPAIRCIGAEAHVVGDVAYVLCYELMPDASLVATNVFIRDGVSWHMIHHQSGPAPAPPRAAVAEDETPEPLQ